MKYSSFLIFFSLIFSPSFLYAQPNSLCSIEGYTILTVNGMLTSESKAQYNKELLGQALGRHHNGQLVKVDFLYNPSHVAGLGEVFDVVNQKLYEDTGVSDYDFIEIWRDASEKVKTQKILFIGHSQGNFYANNLYDLLADKDGGVPSVSMGVYGVASPASRVAGGGKYVTSDTDKIINNLRAGSVLDILPVNANIKLSETDDPNGHSFSDVYLKYQGTRIISEIRSALNKISPNEIQNVDMPCIAPPEIDVAHKVAGAVFFVSDPLALATKNVTVGTATGVYKLASGIYSISKAISDSMRDLGKQNPASVIVADIDTADTSANIFQDSIPEERNMTETPEPIATQETPEVAPTLNGLAVLTPPQAPVVAQGIFIPPTNFIAIPGGGGGSGSLPNPTPPLPPLEPDTTPPNVPIIITPAGWANTNDILITGTAEAGTTVNISGGAILATGTATGGNFSISVTLNQNTSNNLSVTATDTSGNTSASTSLVIDHDNIPPVINSATLSGFVNTAVVGGTLNITISANASGYSNGGISVNNTLVTNFQDVANGNYTGKYVVALGDTSQSAAFVPISVILTDSASNSNITFTTPVGNSFAVNGTYPSSVSQALPTFDANGKFTQDVVLNCATDSGYFSMYAIKDSDSAFQFMHIAGSSIFCPGGQQTFVSSNFGFEDFLGYTPIEGWYYGVVTISYPLCTHLQTGSVCNNLIQSFFRLHRDASGVWTGN